MRSVEIENWALTVIEQVKRHQPIEDSRVEIKADWIDVAKAARRIAGHANAARGEPVLWLIGVDEDSGVAGATRNEIAEWWKQVASQFDGEAPSLVDVNIPVDNTTVVALLFETDRAPYVVKNPSGGTISFEVPWREGTALRTATRSDLIRLLVPIMHLPKVEVLGGELNCFQEESYLYCKLVALRLYVEPAIGEGIVFPYHRCEALFEISNLVPRTPFTDLRIFPPARQPGLLGYFAGPNSVSVDNTDHEVIVRGPGRVDVTGERKLRSQETRQLTVAAFKGSSVRIEVKLVPSYGEYPVSISAEIDWREPNRQEFSENLVGRWLS